jgi:LPXTG-motif cell wall-anchored protein
MPAIYPPQLANTGLDASPVVAGGLGLLAAGALAVAVAARRSRRA